MHIVGPPARLAHRRGQPALHRVGRGCGRTILSHGTDVIGGDGAAEASGKAAGRHRRLGFQLGQRVGPRRVGRGFGAAQKGGADLHRAGPQDQRRSDAAAIADTAGRDDRHRQFVGEPRQQREQPNHLPLGGARIEGAAMPAGFEPLRHHRVGPGLLGGARLGEGRRAGEPSDAARLQQGDESVGKQAHDRRHDSRARGEQRGALRVEINGRRIARFGRDQRAPLAEKLAHSPLVLAVAQRRRIGDPQIDLEATVALPAELLRPGSDAVGRGHQRTHPAHPAGIGDRSSEVGWAGAGHRRHQDRHAQAKPAAKRGDALARAAIGGNGGHQNLTDWAACAPRRARAIGSS